MNAFSRRGACPALSAPMQTGDGLLVRLNPAAGGLAPNALIGLCESAARHGNGIVEVTARGSIQIRGLTPSAADKLAAEVDALRIDVRTGVPVETGPLAGIDPDEIADPRPLAETIRLGIATAGLSARLGPKVSVVVDGGGRLTLDDVLADVRLVAIRRNDGTAWHVSTGGTAATAKPLGTFAEDDASGATLRILNAVAEIGPEARARDLSPPVWEASVAPRKGEGNVPIGILPLGDSTFALVLALPFGSLPAATLIDLARKAGDLGTTEIRPAPRRALILLGLSRPDCEILLAQAAHLCFVTDPTDPRLSISACPGSPSCASGQLSTRDIATELAQASPEFFDGSLALHVSGCAKGCAHPASAALTLVGGENGAGLVVDGAARDLPAGYTPRYEAATGLSRVAGLVRNNRMAGETSATCLARLGAQTIVAAFTQDRA
ncbi:precorrin-3B synthase [Mesorhizobium sp. BE184]|uniref:precorrin-3B synthase n=1 Tax=Mesorhizobium sp. BE184 TaxID=2817714 RepID=UPI00285E63EE|nr:precorrin-3B synthase [Mesorhizobium sp. BE184]MDR7035193.1 precorrin-3B synthase [Mesorhizobium sp. BE184]